MNDLTILVNSTCFDPEYNLASEEYLLSDQSRYNGNVFMLWRNDDSVIIGKNQNTYEEINTDYVKENGIKVVRRLTGGGAVFHDLGNLNYTYITKANDTINLDFKLFMTPIVKMLNALGADAQINGRNDICIGGKKVSGTAQCISNGKVMHHGTLLFSSDMSRIQGALKVNSDKLSSKGIKSVSSRVTNIKNSINADIDICGFCECIAEYMSTSNENAVISDFAPDKIEEVQKLHDDKYSTWEWNYGTSPDFEYRSSKRFSFGTLDVRVNAQNGIISDLVIYGDYFGVKDISDFAKAFIGMRFEKAEFEKVLKCVKTDDYIMNCTSGDFISLFDSI